MEKAKLVIDGLVSIIKEQIDGGMDKNSIAAFVQLDNIFGIAIWANDTEELNDEERYYYNVELRWRIGEIYSWGELYEDCVVCTNTIDFGNINGIEIVMYAFNYHFGNFGKIMLAIITILFAFILFH